LKISELVILIFSAMGARVAILDLRSVGKDLVAGPTEALRLRGRIAALPLVEGDYSLGLYINAGTIREDFLDLTRLTILSKSSRSEIPPYAVQHRGLVELEHTVSLD